MRTPHPAPKVTKGFFIPAIPLASESCGTKVLDSECEEITRLVQLWKARCEEMWVELLGSKQFQNLGSLIPIKVLDVEADVNSPRLRTIIRIKGVLDGFANKGIYEFDIIIVELVPLCGRALHLVGRQLTEKKFHESVP